MKQYQVVSIHYTTDCNLKCSFCYKHKCKKELEKPLTFWYELIPYIKKITKQIALGGGEPFTNIPFIKKFSKLCKKNKLIFNVTSNGKLLMDLNDKELKDTLKDITMVSLSYDKEKVKTIGDNISYFNLVRRIKTLTKTQVGCNLLVTDNYLENNGRKLMILVTELFGYGIDRVFALTPKNFTCSKILENKSVYYALTTSFKKFYVDDLCKMIITENSYDNWKKSCHYFKDIISINEQGMVTGCSFDCNNILLKLDKPKDLLRIKNIKVVERFSCPYLRR